MARVVTVLSVAAVCLASTACNRRVLGVLLDLPEEEAAVASATAASSSQQAQVGNFLRMPLDTVVPAIERTLDPDSVVAMLPRDHAGNIDWVAALRHEVVRPRDGIDGPRSKMPGAFDFKFDFYLPGPTEMFDALFPHSAHVEWLDCAQCHPRIFRTRGTVIKMADVFAGKYCGECHGKVAFPVMTGCERCHTGLVQPPDRAQPELIGTVTMRRANEILAERAADPSADTTSASIQGNAAGVRTDGLPRAQFPHWVHRIRYRCKTCHMAIFEPRGGTNVVTMVDIGKGEACGKCHNGRIAFAPDLPTCERCHPEPSSPPVASEAGAGR